MGTRGPYALVDTTPAKTILVYRNGDQFYVGRKFVFSRRRVANFEALLEQLTEQVDVPFGVRRLYTPTRGHPVLQLDALQAGGKYVAAGRERFKKLDYIHIVPRKPTKMRKLKEIKPVVHCDINVPSRWQTYHRTSRNINVFTNGRLFIPPIKIIIPKFSLSDWNGVLATIGEKVFPLGGVRKLFTMDGHLLDDSKDLQDNYFYVAAGLETFKSFPYWRSPRVPNEIQQRYADIEKHAQKKKKVDSKGKEHPKRDIVPSRSQESVYYAKERKKKTFLEPLFESGAEGDVYKARTPTNDVQEALDVREDPEVKVEVPVDQVPAEIVKEDETDETLNEIIPGAGGKMEKEEERLYEEIERKGGISRVSFKKRFPLRHNTKKKEKRLINEIPQILKHEGGVGTQLEEKYIWAPDCHLVTRQEHIWHHKYKTMLRTATWCKGETALSLHPKDLVVALDLLSKGCINAGWSQGPHVLVASLKNLCKNKKVVPSSEKEQQDILKKRTTTVLLETPLETKVQREPSMGQQSQEEPSPRQENQVPEQQEFPEPSSLGHTLQEKTPEQRESPEQSSLGPPSPEQRPEHGESPEESALRSPFPEQRPERESPEQPALGPPSPGQRPERESPEQPALGPPSPEQRPEQGESPEKSTLRLPSPEQRPEQESPKQPSLGSPSLEQKPEQREFPEESALRSPSPQQGPEQ